MNLERFQAYMDDLMSLQDRVSEPVFIQVFEEKIFDLLARRQITEREIRVILTELEQLFTTEFSLFETEIRQSYNTLLELVNERYDDLGADISRELQQMRAIERANRLQMGDYRQSTVEAVKQIVDKGIRDGLSLSELEEKIAETDAKAAHYAETLARTHLMRYGRVSKYQKALMAEVEIFAYLGVLRETTRPFCRVLLGHRYHIDDILRMRNGNLEPVIDNCGGWNCIHDWEPDPTALPEEVVRGPLQTIEGDTGTLVIFPGEEDEEIEQ